MAENVELRGPRGSLLYRPDIDGLRAVAVISVVAYHSGLSQVKGGFAGVDIFFVISGYLIGAQVYKEIRAQTFSIASFYARRARRILPALFAVLAFTYVSAILLLSPLEMRAFSRDALATITSSSNIVFWLTSSYFAPSSELHPLLMTWSLGVEEQFYLLFPLLMLLLRKWPARLQLTILGGLTALSLFASVFCVSRYPVAAFYLLPTRAWELAAGVLLAILEVHRPRAANAMPKAAVHGISLTGIALLGASIFFLDSFTPFPGYAALLPVSGAVMTIAARRGLANRILARPSLAYVGRISYSWYLWHWPLLSFARICRDSPISTRSALAIALLSFGCAVLSWRFIEQPFRHPGTSATLLLSRYGMAAAAVALPAFVMFVSHGLPQRNREVVQMESAGDTFRRDVCLVTSGTSRPILLPPCVPAGRAQAIALIGDSHAAALASALRSIADRRGYRMMELEKTSCPALLEVSRTAAGYPQQEKECAAFNRARLAFVMDDASIKVVAIAGYWSEPLHTQRFSDRYVSESEEAAHSLAEQSGPLLQRGLDRLIEQLQGAGKRVYLIQDTPVFSFDPMRRLRATLIAPRRAVAQIVSPPTIDWQNEVASAAPDAEAMEARRLLEALAAAHPQITVVDLRKRLCSTDRCRFELGGQALFVDPQHLSPLGAQIALAGLQLP